MPQDRPKLLVASFADDEVTTFFGKHQINELPGTLWEIFGIGHLVQLRYGRCYY